MALPDFEDQRVQIVYEQLCAVGPAPGDDHWEGWVARHIVAALDGMIYEGPQTPNAIGRTKPKLVDD